MSTGGICFVTGHTAGVNNNEMLWEKGDNVQIFLTVKRSLY